MPELPGLPPLNGPLVRCPRCSSGESRVIDSRVVAGGAQRHRRRECSDCGERFTTYEKAAEALPQVVKRSGDRAAFDPGRLRGAILRAIEKRPVTAADVDAAVNRIRQRLPLEEGSEVLSARIGEWVMDELRALDRVAYVRFAAGRRPFVDLAELPGPPDPARGEAASARSGSGTAAPEARGPQLPLAPRE